MPFGKKLPGQDRSGSEASEPKQIASFPAPPKALPARNLSNGPPGSNLTALRNPPAKRAASPVIPTKKRSSEAVETQADDSDASAAIKRSKVEQKQLDALAQPDGLKRCAECKATETSTWRRDMAGNLICNKCGLRKRKDHKAPSRRSVQRQPRLLPAPPTTTQPPPPPPPPPVILPAPAKADTPPLQSRDNDHVNTTSPPPIQSVKAPVVDPRPPRPWINAVRQSAADQQAGSSKAVEPPQQIPPKPAVGTQTIRMTMPVPPSTTKSDLKPEKAPTPSPAHVAQVARIATIDELIAASRPKLPDKPAKLPTPSRRPGPKKAVNPRTLEPKICLDCGTDESPAWRKDKEGNPLCNKCMLRQKRAAERKSTPVLRKRNLSIPDLASRSSVDKHAVPESPDVTPGSSSKSQKLPPISNQISKDALRTDSQIVYDDFTHLNSRSSFLSTSGEASSSRAKYEDIAQKEAHLPKSAPRRIMISSLTNGVSTTPTNSFYGSSPAPEKSTTMISRADSRAAAQKTSQSPERLTQKPAGRKCAPGWVMIEDDSDLPSRPLSPPWKSSLLDLLPGERQKRRTLNGVVETATRESTEDPKKHYRDVPKDEHVSSSGDETTLDEHPGYRQPVAAAAAKCDVSHQREMLAASPTYDRNALTPDMTLDTSPRPSQAESQDDASGPGITERGSSESREEDDQNGVHAATDRVATAQHRTPMRYGASTASDPMILSSSSDISSSDENESEREMD